MTGAEVDRPGTDALALASELPLSAPSTRGAGAAPGQHGQAPPPPPLPRRLHQESVNDLVQAAVARAGLYSAHSLRAGFVTFAHLPGASDRAIAHQTRHRSIATVGTYVRTHETWTDNAATMLGL